MLSIIREGLQGTPKVNKMTLPVLTIAVSLTSHPHTHMYNSPFQQSLLKNRRWNMSNSMPAYVRLPNHEKDHEPKIRFQIWRISCSLGNDKENVFTVCNMVVTKVVVREKLLLVTFFKAKKCKKKHKTNLCLIITHSPGTQSFSSIVAMQWWKTPSSTHWTCIHFPSTKDFNDSKCNQTGRGWADWTERPFLVTEKVYFSHSETMKQSCQLVP